MLQFSSRQVACALLPVLIAVLLVCPGSARAASFPVDDLAAFEGDWKLDESEHDEVARRSSIDEAVAGLSWVMRKFAGGALKRSTAPPQRIQFIWDGQRLQQRIAGGGGESSRVIEIGAPPRDSKDIRGASFSSSWQWSDSGLQLTWAQHQAHGHNLYRVDSVSGFLVVRHTIQIDAISNLGAIVYESRFGRSDFPRIAAGRDAEAASRPSETR